MSNTRRASEKKWLKTGQSVFSWIKLIDLVVGCIVTGCSLVGRRAVTDVCPVNFSGGGPANLRAVLAAVKDAIIIVVINVMIFSVNRSGSRMDEI